VMPCNIRAKRLMSPAFQCFSLQQEWFICFYVSRVVSTCLSRAGWDTFNTD
jgi:hypothetical protein